MIDVHFTQRRLPLICVSLILVLAWGLRRLVQTVTLVDGQMQNQFTGILLIIFCLFAWQLWLAWRERPFETLTPEAQERVAALTVCVNLPAYNEDVGMLNKALESIFAQTRLPDRVQVVDDGSTVGYADLRAYWLSNAPSTVAFSWIRTPNRGKRHAQIETFTDATETILVTLDSDTILHHRAIEEGLKPFADHRITSVAGLVLALNKHKNLLTRVEDLVVTTSQLTMRSTYSKLGNVTVNSGAFALYRAEVVRDAIDGYLHETIRGRPVQFSDDSLLTLYACVRGRTVQQPSAIALSAWPETLSHHVRQQVRWTRGSFIRSLWRFRYLPPRGAALWLGALGWALFFATTGMFALMFFVMNAGQIAVMMGISLSLSYAASVRTLSIQRSDETLVQQIGVYALSPLVILWAWFIYRPLRVWGMLTCLRTGWGTRERVETISEDDVLLPPPAQPDPVAVLLT